MSEKGDDQAWEREEAWRRRWNHCRRPLERTSKLFSISLLSSAPTSWSIWISQERPLFVYRVRNLRSWEKVKIFSWISKGNTQESSLYNTWAFHVKSKAKPIIPFYFMLINILLLMLSQKLLSQKKKASFPKKSFFPNIILHLPLFQLSIYKNFISSDVTQTKQYFED